MSIKLVVLYPHPRDPAAFERAYHGQHMPLMHSLIEPNERVPTYRVRSPDDGPFYRVAQIEFGSMRELEAFARTDGAKRARLSSEAVSTGGPPLVLVCERDLV